MSPIWTLLQKLSELTIAGGYVYDDTSSDSNNKVLVLFGHTRTDPIRYFYRFATFIGGDSAAITWDPWEELNISIEVPHVKPVYAFNRVFVFWAVVEGKCRRSLLCHRHHQRE